MNQIISWIISRDWSRILQAMSAIGTIAAATAIFFAIRQLRFEAWLRAQRIFVNDRFRKSRGVVFSYLTPRELTHDAETKDDFAKVCQLMDELCRLKPFLGRRKILRVWDDPIGKAWFVASKWVKREREICSWNSKWDEFEKLGKAALKRVRRKHRQKKRYPRFRVDALPPS